MFDRLFPSPADNAYRGHPVAMWIFWPLTAMTLLRSLVHIFAPDGGAQSIATIPLDQMTEAGASGIITLFALWGLSQLIVGGLYLVTLLRYRALVPLMYLLFVFEWVSRLAIGVWKPMPALETPPGVVGNWVFSAVGLAMLFLALRRRGIETV